LTHRDQRVSRFRHVLQCVDRELWIIYHGSLLLAKD
jgi:hypothetical protein